MDKYGVARKTRALNTNAVKNGFSLQFLLSVTLQILFTKFFLTAYSPCSRPLWGGKDDKGDNTTHGASQARSIQLCLGLEQMRRYRKRVRFFFSGLFFGETQLLNLIKLSMETTHPTAGKGIYLGMT